jgi:hypothetical protein
MRMSKPRSSPKTQRMGTREKVARTAVYLVLAAFCVLTLARTHDLFAMLAVCAMIFLAMAVWIYE